MEESNPRQDILASIAARGGWKVDLVWRRQKVYLWE